MTEYNAVEVKKDLVQPEAEETVETVDTKKKEIKQITKAKPVKKGLIERLVTSFIGPDGIRDVSNYVGHEIIAPAVKNVVADAIKGGVDGLLYGREGVGRSYQGPSRNYTASNTRTNYAKTGYSRGPRDDRQGDGYHKSSPDRRPRFSSESYIIRTRDEASFVLSELRSNAEQYGFISIADFKEMVGADDGVYSENNYGWMFETLEHAGVRPNRNGYVIVLPPAEVL